MNSSKYQGCEENTQRTTKTRKRVACDLYRLGVPSPVLSGEIDLCRRFSDTIDPSFVATNNRASHKRRTCPGLFASAPADHALDLLNLRRSLSWVSISGAAEASPRGGRAGALYEEHREAAGAHGAQASHLVEDWMDRCIGGCCALMGFRRPWGCRWSPWFFDVEVPLAGVHNWLRKEKMHRPSVSTSARGYFCLCVSWNTNEE